MAVSNEHRAFRNGTAVRIAGVLALLSIPACGGGGAEGNPDPEPTPLVATPTARGESLDNPVTAIIGAAVAHSVPQMAVCRLECQPVRSLRIRREISGQSRMALT